VLWAILAERASVPDRGLVPVGVFGIRTHHCAHPPDCRVLVTTRRLVGLVTVVLVGGTRRTTTRGAEAFSWITLAPGGAFWPGLSRT
jgi:hypothetical protein